MVRYMLSLIVGMPRSCASQIPTKKCLRDINRLLKKNKSQEEAVLFIKQKLDAAKWFIEAIEQRYNTLLMTINSIVEHQKAYFFKRR